MYIPQWHGSHERRESSIRISTSNVHIDTRLRLHHSHSPSLHCQWSLYIRVPVYHHVNYHETTKRISWSPYNQIILGIELYNVYSIATAFTPTELGLYELLGNEATCKFQAWLFQIGIASVYTIAFFSVSISYLLSTIIWQRGDSSKSQQGSTWVLSLTVGMIMAIAVILFASRAPPQAASWLRLTFSSSLYPDCTLYSCNDVCTADISSNPIRDYERESSETRILGESNVLAICVLPFAVLYLVWTIQFAAFVAPITVPSNYPIYVLAAIFGPLQAFWMHWLSSAEIGNRFNDRLAKLLNISII